MINKTQKNSEQKLINKIFLIGNGFDIALGLKTKYSDFLVWLLKKYIIEAIDSNIKKAPHIYNNYIQTLGIYEPLIINGYSSNNLFNVLLDKEKSYSRDEVLNIDNLISLNEYIISKKINIDCSQSELIFSDIYRNSIQFWVDIEGVYFEKLKLIINHNKIEYIESLNNELDLIKEYLKEYLSDLKTSFNKDEAKNYLNQFEEQLLPNDFTFLQNDKVNLKTNNYYFLNFNYTNSLTNILSHSESLKPIENQIHGNLQDKELPMIFGFGDEMDEVYKKIEELNDNRFFKHIKSFQYFKTNKYRELLTFLNSGDYQVCIYGHSCGLSDRVMLNEIFEHENCKSIKIYYYNDNDFTTKTMEISRHFKSNQLMRQKLVNKDENCKIPQIPQ